MHSSFYIETAGGKRKCRGSCDRDIPRGEKCFVESYSDGMYVRNDSYHLTCGIRFLNQAVERLTQLQENISKELT